MALLDLWNQSASKYALLANTLVDAANLHEPVEFNTARANTEAAFVDAQERKAEYEAHRLEHGC
jgi:hypothetical protein